jgi:murein DD-endopeptidase MepM/ murein hydrolase activator NlpD
MSEAPGGSVSRTPGATPPAAIVWPAVGPLTSYFGPSHPLGIDIGLAVGAPILAAAPGSVAFAGGDACCSYGYYVDIDHGRGILTRYGHLVRPSLLRAGDRIKLGQVIGYAGSAGDSTGPHLHFEIRLNGVPVNPLLVLPAQH